jgi:flagellar hook-associated protein 2
MSGPISFGGLASGLDTAAIIDALVAAERIPINQLQTRKTVSQQKINLLGTFQGHVDALLKKAQEFSTSGGAFLVNKTKLSSEGFFSVSASGSSAAGSYAIEVEALASVDRYALSDLQGIADADADLGDVSVAFDYDGQTYNVALTAGSASLNDLAAAIDTATGGAVQAKVINTGTTASPNNQLVLEGTETGADFAIDNLVVTNAAGNLDTTTQLSDASNARIVFNGLTVERSTNTFTGLVDGLTIEAQALTTQAVNASVSIDEQGIIDKLKEFTKAYNEVVNFINQQNEYDADSKAGGPLSGETALRTIMNTMNSTLFDGRAVDDTSAFGSLGLVGIKLGSDGTLSVDETKVKAKLAEDPAAFADFFLDSDGFDNGGAAEGTPGAYVDTSVDTGVFSLLAKGLERLLDVQNVGNGITAKGLIASRKSSFEADITSLDDQIERLELRMEGFEANLVARFSALEQLMGNLNSQQSFISNLQANNSNN